MIGVRIDGDEGGMFASLFCTALRWTGLGNVVGSEGGGGMRAYVGRRHVSPC